MFGAPPAMCPIEEYVSHDCRQPDILRLYAAQPIPKANVVPQQS
jgi:hypothetical protein